MHFNLTDLRLFVHVVEAGSITRGAARSFLAVAAASTRIRNMEISLGAPLLVRNGRGIEATPAGGTLLHHARIIMRQLDHLRGDLAEHTNRMKGYVRVLANTNALAELLPEVLSGFLATHPQVTIDLEERSSNEIIGAVAEGNADIGIFAGSVDIPDLECFPFRSDRLVLVASSEHPLGNKSCVTLADCLDYEFIGLRQASAIQSFLVDMAARAGKELKVRVRLDSFDAVCRMAERNIGVGVVPSSSAERCSKTMRINIVGLTNKWAIRHLNVGVFKESTLSPQATLLFNYLKNASDPAVVRH